jgi:alpha-tubulin suppressor-like RCC1 family protein
MTRFKVYVACIALGIATCDLRSEKPAGYVVGWGAGSETWASFSGKAILTNVIEVAAGSDHGLALRCDGRVVGLGANQYGQINVPPGLSNVIAIAAGDNFSIALQSDGHVVRWGFGHSELSAPLTNIVEVAAGGGTWLARTSNRQVFRTLAGHETQPFTAASSKIVSNAVHIAVGGARNADLLLATMPDGEFVFRGGDCAMPTDTLRAIRGVALGERQGLALKKDDTVFGWGLNYHGQATGVPTRTSDRIASDPVMLGGHLLSNVVAVAAAENYSMALKRDGTVAAWGGNLWRQLDVPSGLSNVVAIAACRHFCLAITTDKPAADRFWHSRNETHSDFD